MSLLRLVCLFCLLVMMGFHIACGSNKTCQSDDSCATPRVCKEGACACPTGQSDCKGTCIDTTNDTQNCGECGALCKRGFVCTKGICACKDGESSCGGECINTGSDSNNCGKCNIKCEAGESCVKGVCKKPALDCSGNPSLPVDCGSGCVDTLRNPDFCGDCKKSCGATKACRNGVCECAVGAALCGELCSSLASDGANCGACGNKCSAGTKCAAGKCIAVCPKELPQSCGEGCVDLTSDFFHCGKCDNQCNLGEVCTNSKCSCSGGDTICDITGGAKACVDTQSDWSHCGGCGKACKASELCEAGKCTAKCAAGATSCYGSCADTKTSADHCGKCGQSCDANQTCQEGKCVCSAGQTLCQVAESASKERCVDLKANGQHCGACGNKCKAGLFCIDSKCKEIKTSCEGKETLCSNNCVDLQTNATHCGSCGNSCPDKEECKAGTCAGSCQAGSTLCGGVCCPNSFKCCSDQCVNPNTPEVCDGVDNDCNGKTDDNVPGDGEACVLTNLKGPCAIGKRACEKGKISCTQIYQPKAEDCTNKIDDDCDGVPDSAPCTCTDGEFRPCFSGATKNRGVGECKDGKQTCAGGKWSVCTGEALPSAEKCDGKDNNCNNQIDEGNPESGKDCTSSGKGACQPGTETCLVGQIACVPKVMPVPEVCDNVDNDCDGTVDEELARNCYSGAAGSAGKGTCRGGTQTCVAGNWGACKGEVVPNPKEKCDGRDDDCDGTIDNGCNCKDGEKKICGSSKGECTEGETTCQNGSFGACVGATIPTGELCDAKDNDCDGSIDEDFANKGKACTLGIGGCEKPGTFVCDTTKSKTICDATPGTPALETCDNVDNNCDGSVDENLSRACYTGTAGTDGKGLCKKGTETCSAGKWGACNGEVTPQTEICDGKDNDCNGQTDEITSCTCTQGEKRVCGTDTGQCRAGEQVCNAGAWGPCNGEIPPVSETCNGKDDDCDGSTDEDFANKGQSCTVGVGGCAKTATFVCKADGTGTECSIKPGAPSIEVCDGIDNNCNGNVDEGNPGGGNDCFFASGNSCQKSTTKCEGGRIQCNGSAPGSVRCSSSADCAGCPATHRSCPIFPLNTCGR